MGREIIRALLADDSVRAVHTLGRRPLDLQHPKLQQHQIDFAALNRDPGAPGLAGLTEAYVALGTTIKVAGSQEAFRAVDFDAVLASAKAAIAAGARRIGVVSAMGADPRSRVFYNRVKGEAEAALAQLDLDALVIARPSFLAGDRKALGQPERSGEALALRLSRALAPLIPDNFKSIPAARVAAGLLAAVPTARGRLILSSGQLQRSSAAPGGVRAAT